METTNSIETRLQKIFSDNGLEYNKDIKTWYDIDIDSLGVVELIMNVEDEFNIEISDNDAEKLQNINELLEYLNKNVRT